MYVPCALVESIVKPFSASLTYFLNNIKKKKNSGNNVHVKKKHFPEETFPEYP